MLWQVSRRPLRDNDEERLDDDTNMPTNATRDLTAFLRGFIYRLLSFIYACLEMPVV